MSLKQMLSFLFLEIFVLKTGVSFAQNTVQQEINTFVNASVNKNAKISFEVMNIESSEIIARYNEDSAIVSASTTKLFSTFAALKTLGSNFKMKTRLYVDGMVDSNGTLIGNVWIRGGGDISLGSKYFDEEFRKLRFLDKWIEVLKSAGIKKISGAIIADGSEFGYDGVPEGWDEEDTGNYYGVHAQGINFLDNTIFLSFKTKKAGQKTTITSIFPEIEEINFKNEVESANINRDRAYLFGSPYEYNRSAKGYLPANRDAFEVKGSMPDPEITLAKMFKNKLQESGIVVDQGALSVRLNWFLAETNYDDLTLLEEFEGASLGEIIQYTNQKSVNLFAEGLLNILGYEANKNGSNANSLKQLRIFNEAFIKSKGLELYDGSGLSEMNRISAKHFMELLHFIYKSKEFEEFYNSLPIAGESGTIKSLCEKGAGNGRIHAKSGTLKKVKSYVGFVQSKSGKLLAFAFTVNDFTCANYQIIKYMEPVLNAIAAL